MVTDIISSDIPEYNEKPRTTREGGSPVAGGTMSKAGLNVLLGWNRLHCRRRTWASADSTEAQAARDLLLRVVEGCVCGATDVKHETNLSFCGKH